MRLNYRHVIGQEPPASLAQQPEDGACLTGVGAGGEHHPDAIKLHAGRVQQHAVAGNHHESQQRLDDVGVRDMR